MKRQRRSLVFLGLSLLSLFSGFSTGRDLWFTIAYLLGSLLILSFIWSYINLRQTKISRVTRTRRTQVGQPLEERILLTNTSRFPKLWLEVRDNSNFPNHNISRVVNGLPPNRKYGWRTATQSFLRGRYRLGPLMIRTSDPFGLFPMERMIDATNNVVVYPMTVDIHHFPLPAGILSGGDALRMRAYQATANAVSVREYAPGDSFNRIHWKSSARRNRLIVKEFELDPLTDIWIVPDMAASVQAGLTAAEAAALAHSQGKEDASLPLSTEEYVVTIAASLAQYFLRQDRAVGLVANTQSREFVQPDRGERQSNRLLETLAVLQADGDIELAGSLLMQSNRFPRGTTLIVITPTIDLSWATTARELTRRGLRIATVLVNPEQFSYAGHGESAEELLSLLQINNIPCYFVNAGDNLSAVLGTHRRR
ncbi:MAG: DUF58 domain-containing protein [Candidatus Promineifilaceae bacterium]